MKHKHCRILSLCLVLMAVLAVPAFAAGYGEPDVTVQTTMRQLRNNPSVKGSGFYTYSTEWSESDHRYEDTTLLDYVGTGSAQDAADAMNLLIENYNSGVQITWQVYSWAWCSCTISLPKQPAQNTRLSYPATAAPLRQS